MGHRINLKTIVDERNRLKVMSQLINDNVENEDGYVLIPNWFNTSDPKGPEGEVPSFTTAKTYPPIPINTNFRCGSLAANAEDLVRASELINTEIEPTLSEEENRLNSLIGNDNNLCQLTKNDIEYFRRWLRGSRLVFGTLWIDTVSRRSNNGISKCAGMQSIW